MVDHFITRAELTPEGQAFIRGFDQYVLQQRDTRRFWAPRDSTWNSYSATGYRYTKWGAVPQIDATHASDGGYRIVKDILAVGNTLRSLPVWVFWWPESGFWYQITKESEPQPPVPNESGPLREMNRQLDEIDRNTHMTPQEKRDARAAVIDGMY